MEPIANLHFGFHDAANYNNSPHKRIFFEKTFYRDSTLEKICDMEKYYLMGEKGTGKTAYAVYLSQNKYLNITSKYLEFKPHDYITLIKLKEKQRIESQDYIYAWKVILYLFIFELVSEHESNFQGEDSSIFLELRKHISTFFPSAANIFLKDAMEIIKSPGKIAKLLGRIFQIEDSNIGQYQFDANNSSVNLRFIEEIFKKALSSRNFQGEYILFIDRIDFRPKNITYADYHECVSGLVYAIDNVNEFLAKIGQTKTKVKVMLLIRQDIFASIGIHNLNNQLRDRSVILDWRTYLKNARESRLFTAIEHILSAQQNNFTEGEQLKQNICWDHYFPYKVQRNSREPVDSFTNLIRYTFSRPRDVIFLLSTMRDNKSLASPSKRNFFTHSDFNRCLIQQYTYYMKAEIKEQLSYYFDETEYDHFMYFFEFLHGISRFNYKEFTSYFLNFKKHLQYRSNSFPEIFSKPETFLQMLFSLNIVCYKDIDNHGHNFFRWYYHQKDYSNINPKVKIGTDYEVHPGLLRALNLGSKLKT